jgi:hypothetical protein
MNVGGGLFFNVEFPTAKVRFAFAHAAHSMTISAAQQDLESEGLSRDRQSRWYKAQTVWRGRGEEGCEIARF